MIKVKFTNSATVGFRGEDLAAVAMRAAPIEYASAIASKEATLAAGTYLTIEDIESVMTKQYRIAYGGAKVKDDGNELSFSAYNGKYYNCREMWHRVTDCSNDKIDK